MPKLTPEQDKLLTMLAAADKEWRDAALTLEERIRAEKEAALGQLRVKRDLLAYQSKQAGIPVTQISHRGLRTKATKTAYEAIENGGRYAPKPVDVETQAHSEFARLTHPGHVRVTPAVEALAPLLPLLGVEAEYHSGTPVLQSADFLVDAADATVTPITEGWNEALGVRHPVVALVMGEDPSYRQRMLEFAA